MADPVSPDSSPGELLTQAVRALRRTWVGDLGEWGLSPHQARALRVVAGADGTRPSDLARALRIAPRSATEVVDDLAGKGLVRRAPAPSDRRAVLVQLTERGRAVAEQVRRAREDNSARFFARLSERDRTELSRILRRLMADQPDASAETRGPAQRA